MQLLECTNPVRNRWRVRWDVQKQDDINATYMEEVFDHKPSVDEIRSTVTAWINTCTDEAILHGFIYDGTPVWLSQVNQLNYKAAHDLALQTGGKTLPVTFKLGTDDRPVYRTFNTLDDIQDFYIKVVTYIQDTIAKGWRQKDNFNPNDYGLTTKQTPDALVP